MSAYYHRNIVESRAKHPQIMSPSASNFGRHFERLHWPFRAPLLVISSHSTRHFERSEKSAFFDVRGLTFEVRFQITPTMYYFATFARFAFSRYSPPCHPAFQLRSSYAQSAGSRPNIVISSDSTRHFERSEKSAFFDVRGLTFEVRFQITPTMYYFATFARFAFSRYSPPCHPAFQLRSSYAQSAGSRPNIVISSDSTRHFERSEKSAFSTSAACRSKSDSK